MVTMQTLQDEKRDDVLRLEERHGTLNLRIFGSVARGESHETSDLDLLVEWEAGRSLLDHVALVQDLEELLGTKVHVGTERAFALVRAPPHPA
jgi:predicted nucleotidyltransferase